MKNEAGLIIEKLNLRSHPEGGYYSETYRSDLVFDAQAVSEKFTGRRSCSTSIYFLLEASDFSAFHRIKADEIWHFYTGSSIQVHVITPKGHFHQISLGNNLSEGEVFQAEVKAGYWFAASLKSEKGFALTGCTTAPGFEFEDFELAKREKLVKLFPQHRRIIEKYTRS